MPEAWEPLRILKIEPHKMTGEKLPTGNIHPYIQKLDGWSEKYVEKLQ